MPPAETAAPPAGATPPSAPDVPWSRRTFAALSNRDYRLFFVGMALSSVGTWARQTAQQWYVWGETHSEAWLSWVSAASLLPIALVSLPAGALVDRVDRRRLLLVLQVLEMCLSATLAVLVATGVARAPHVVAIATCLGVAGGIEMPCRQAFIVEMVGRQGLPNAIAMNSVMFNLPLVLGPAVATELMARAGVASVFVFDAASFLAAVVGFAMIRVPPRQAAPDGEPLSRQVLAGVRYVRSSRPVRAILLLLATAMVFGWSYASLLAAYAQRVLGEGERGYGLLYSSSGIGACVGGLWVAGRHAGRPHVLLVACLLGFALSLLTMALWPGLALAVVCRTLAGFCMISFFATGNSTIQMAVPDGLRGRVMALWTFVFGLSLPLGQLLLGAVARVTSVPLAFGGGASVVLAVALAVAATRPFAEDRPRPLPS